MNKKYNKSLINPSNNTIKSMQISLKNLSKIIILDLKVKLIMKST